MFENKNVFYMIKNGITRDTQGEQAFKQYLLTKIFIDQKNIYIYINKNNEH